MLLKKNAYEVISLLDINLGNRYWILKGKGLVTISDFHK